MIKTITLGTVLTAMYNQPTYSLLAIVALLFIVQIIAELCSLSSCGAEELMKPKTPTNQSYEEIKELFNNGLDEEVDESVQTVSTTSQIKCISPNFSEWAYADLQTYCRLHSLKPKSRKKLKLIESLESLCT